MIGPSVKKIGVVFIHGFTGNALTWMNSAGERFCDMLSSEEHICKEFEFFEFDYYTQVLDVFKSATVQSLKKILNKIPFVEFDTKIQKTNQYVI